MGGYDYSFFLCCSNVEMMCTRDDVHIVSTINGRKVVTLSRTWCV